MTTRTINSVVTGKPIPVTVDLKVNPLMSSGRIICNGHGREMMDDEWIYTTVKGYGSISINVNRAAYCQKIYMSKMTIMETIGFGKMTLRLQTFISKISDKLVFIFNGTTYIIFLKKTKSGFDIDSIKPYWSTVASGGIMQPWEIVERLWPGSTKWDYKGLDINKVFALSL